MLGFATTALDREDQKMAQQKTAQHRTAQGVGPPDHGAGGEVHGSGGR